MEVSKNTLHGRTTVQTVTFMACLCWLLVGTHFEKYYMGGIGLKVNIETDLQDSDIHLFDRFLLKSECSQKLIVCAPANKPRRRCVWVMSMCQLEKNLHARSVFCANEVKIPQTL